MGSRNSVVRNPRLCAFAWYIWAYNYLVNDKTKTNGHVNGHEKIHSAEADDEDSDDDNEDEGGIVEAGVTGGTLAP